MHVEKVNSMWRIVDVGDVVRAIARCKNGRPAHPSFGRRWLRGFRSKKEAQQSLVDLRRSARDGVMPLGY